jgi:hypothetical protein
VLMLFKLFHAPTTKDFVLKNMDIRGGSFNTSNVVTAIQHICSIFLSPVFLIASVSVLCQVDIIIKYCHPISSLGLLKSDGNLLSLSVYIKEDQNIPLWS